MLAISFWRPGLLLGLLGLVRQPTASPDPDFKLLMAKDLAGAPGKEALVLAVEYPPGAVEPVHRHDAQAFVYVLEGSVVMQVKGQPPDTLAPGDTFYEGSEDVHLVGRNASETRPARFVVFLVKEKGAPAVLPAQ
jgi:quercetin dioxygenase-like cupin family protein